MSANWIETVDSSPLPHGYHARPPRRDDAPVLTELLSAIDIEVTGKSDITLNDFLGDWEGTDLENDAILIEGPDGTPAAYADMDIRGDVVFYLYGYVHPFQRGRGLGTFLVHWGQRRARAIASANAPATARIVTRIYVNEKAEPARELLADLGYAPIRATYTMAIDLDRKPPAPDWPAGITIRNFVPGVDDQAAYEAYEEAFADMWQRPRGTFDQFSSKLRRPYFNPRLWYLAMDGEEIAGTLFSDDIDGKGWIEIVGVRRPYFNPRLWYLVARPGARVGDAAPRIFTVPQSRRHARRLECRRAESNRRATHLRTRRNASRSEFHSVRA